LEDRSLILGIDIGTTKVAAVIINTDHRLLASASIPHNAQLPGPPDYAEQDVNILLETARTVVHRLPEDVRSCIKAVGVTGQMHGTIVLDKKNNPLTPLITWQDGRCIADFLTHLNAAAGYELKTGFGCATLAWLCQNKKLPPGTAACATIHDLLVAVLCGLEKPITDPTDAASWGLFDLNSLQWDIDAVNAAQIPESILPEVLPCSTIAGRLSKEQAEQFGIPASIPVTVAIGDNQASLLATFTMPETQLALSLGTSAQLSAVLPPTTTATTLATNIKYEYRPYPGNRLAIVAAPLCGGSAWTWLVESIQKWFTDLCQPCPPKDEIYNKINQLGLHAKTNLTVKPNFLGERYDPDLRGLITGINMQNFDLPGLARALAKGIIENLKQMLPENALTGRTQIVGSGNALRKNPLLQSMVEEVFNLPLEMLHSIEEAATGAAVNVNV